ncbi:MFS transporter [Nocardioides marmotae]|uniref:MFS transporter n=1 Tax=Nocardioides marmotae TaxID=2663857 RepID=UPI0020A67671|nr:MFS transporter [Nocardioides marmotae]
MSEEVTGTREVPDGQDGDYTPDPRRWRILGVTLVVGFMSLLDVTIVNVAIPSMQDGLSTTTGTIQWVVSGYALAFGLTLVAGGRLGDAYGRRRLMLIGLTGFILSSAAVGFAPNIETVIAARLAQGATAGLLTPQNSGLIQQLFRGPERGRAFGAFGLTVSLSSALGPVLGGAIIAVAGEEDGWRWLFLVNVPIGLAALVAIAVIVPGRDRRDESGTWIDVPGALLLGGAVLCVLYPLVSLESGRLLPLVLLLGAPAFGWGFVRWEARLRRTGRPPLLDVSLLRTLPGYSTGMAIGTLYFTGFTGIFLVLSVHLQRELGLTPLMAGLLTTPFAAGAAVTAPLAGRVVSRAGRTLTVVALVTMMTGTALTAWLAPQFDDGAIWMALVPCLLLAGLGGGGVISPNFTLTLAEVPPRMGGAAGAALQTGQRIGSSLGAALLMTTYGVALGPFGAGGALRAALLVSLAVLSTALAAAVWSRRHE